MQQSHKVLRTVGVGPINRDDVPATLQTIRDLSGVPLKYMTLLGSVGKKPQSGDIDIALCSQLFDEHEIHNRMVKSLGKDRCTLMIGLGIGSYAVPIAGDESNGLVQVDFMYVDNPLWAEFAYHSPSNEQSKYKGAIRTILLMAVAAQYSTKGIDQFIYENGELIVRVGRTLDLNKGLRRIYQHRPYKKVGDGRVKNLVTVKSLRELRQMYPKLTTIDAEIIVDDPQQVLNLIFHSNDVTPKDVGSAEDVLALIHAKFTAEQVNDIFEKAKERLRGKDKMMEIPPELQ